MTSRIFTALLSLCFLANAAFSATNHDDNVARGFDFLVHGKYGDPGLSDVLFENLWRVWDGSDAERAALATNSERKAIAYARYGFFDAPYENDGLPMGYTKGGNGTWMSNCLLCHGGAVNGKPMVGAPNNRIDLETLAEDIFLLTAQDHDPTPTRPVTLDKTMSTSRGLTNAVVFSNDLLQTRDANLDLIDFCVDLGPMIDHDLDAPPWWILKHKTHFYVDAFVPKNPRALIQFAMGHQNDGDTLRGYLPDFERVLAYLDTIEAPKYPGKIQAALAAKGKTVFEAHCAKCHGFYGEDRSYPNRLIPHASVQTDDVRLYALTSKFRAYYLDSWLGYYGALDVKTDGTGYVAPPLDGIWASAPYFHNGSVPTLYHVLNPEERPKVWRVKDYDSYNYAQAGLLVDSFETIPEYAMTPSQRRRFYDTTQFSKSNQGHFYSNILSAEENRAVLEYLKSL